MSVSANIDVKIRADTNPVMLVLKRLLGFGWSFNYEGAAFYLPVGDNDNFDWRRGEVSDVDLLAILRQKGTLGELIGVTMTWKDTGIGGDFLFYSDGLVSLNITVNRKTIENHFTDVNWYLAKIIPPMIEENLKIESVEFCEHI